MKHGEALLDGSVGDIAGVNSVFFQHENLTGSQLVWIVANIIAYVFLLRAYRKVC